MPNSDIFATIAMQLIREDTHIELQGKSLPVKRTSSQHLKMVTFAIDGREYTAIEQNPEKPSEWGKLARKGHQVVQFKDNQTNRFIAVSVDGQVKEYGRQHG
jgi:hypothetical protein